MNTESSFRALWIIAGAIALALVNSQLSVADDVVDLAEFLLSELLT